MHWQVCDLSHRYFLSAPVSGGRGASCSYTSVHRYSTSCCGALRFGQVPRIFFLVPLVLFPSLLNLAAASRYSAEVLCRKNAAIAALAASPAAVPKPAADVLGVHTAAHSYNSHAATFTSAYHGVASDAATIAAATVTCRPAASSYVSGGAITTTTTTTKNPSIGGSHTAPSESAAVSAALLSSACSNSSRQPQHQVLAAEQVRQFTGSVLPLYHSSLAAHTKQRCCIHLLTGTEAAIKIAPQLTKEKVSAVACCSTLQQMLLLLLSQHARSATFGGVSPFSDNNIAALVRPYIRCAHQQLQKQQHKCRVAAGVYTAGVAAAAARTAVSAVRSVTKRAGGKIMNTNADSLARPTNAGVATADAAAAMRIFNVSVMTLANAAPLVREFDVSTMLLGAFRFYGLVTAGSPRKPAATSSAWSQRRSLCKSAVGAAALLHATAASISSIITESFAAASAVIESSLRTELLLTANSAATKAGAIWCLAILPAAIVTFGSCESHASFQVPRVFPPPVSPVAASVAGQVPVAATSAVCGAPPPSPAARNRLAAVVGLLMPAGNVMHGDTVQLYCMHGDRVQLYRKSGYRLQTDRMNGVRMQRNDIDGDRTQQSRMHRYSITQEDDLHGGTQKHLRRFSSVRGGIRGSCRNVWTAASVGDQLKSAAYKRQQCNSQKQPEKYASFLFADACVELQKAVGINIRQQQQQLQQMQQQTPSVPYYGLNGNDGMVRGVCRGFSHKSGRGHGERDGSNSNDSQTISAGTNPCTDNFKSRSRRKRKYKSSGVGSLEMNSAPPGSAFEEKMFFCRDNPIEAMPWEIQVPFYKFYSRQDNVWLQLMQGNWTYADGRKMFDKPAGVVDGGAANYDGGGTTVPLNPRACDRPRAQQQQQPRERVIRGTELREALDTPHRLRLDRLPCGNQDVYFGESDADLEDRLWGAFHHPHALEEYFLESGWRDLLPEFDTNEFPMPWTHTRAELTELPLHGRDPSPGPPVAPVEFDLAAGGRFAGYVLDPGWTRQFDYVEQHREMRSWQDDDAEKENEEDESEVERDEREADEGAQTKQKKTQKKKKKAKGKISDPALREAYERGKLIIETRYADIRQHPVYKKAIFEDATHEAAVAAAERATADTIISMWKGEDIATDLPKITPRWDFEGGGNWRVPEGEGRTLAINLFMEDIVPHANCDTIRLAVNKINQVEYGTLEKRPPVYMSLVSGELYIFLRHPWQTLYINVYGISPLPYKSISPDVHFFLRERAFSYLSPKMTKEEMAEMWHYWMTEAHREGRYTDFPTEIGDYMDIEYETRADRRRFPRLMALYKPLWSHRKFGDEYGDALRPEEIPPDSALSTFGASLDSGSPAICIQRNRKRAQKRSARRSIFGIEKDEGEAYICTDGKKHLLLQRPLLRINSSGPSSLEAPAVDWGELRQKSSSKKAAAVDSLADARLLHGTDVRKRVGAAATAEGTICRDRRRGYKMEEANGEQEDEDVTDGGSHRRRIEEGSQQGEEEEMDVNEDVNFLDEYDEFWM